MESELSKIKAVLGKGEAFLFGGGVAVRLQFLVKIIVGAEDAKGLK